MKPQSLWEIEREKRIAIEAACRPIRERIEAKYADSIAEAERYEAEERARCFERQYEKALGNSPPIQRVAHFTTCPNAEQFRGPKGGGA